ncbi:hypothetical protein [Cupriavidus basilensis]|nr:hypothetical protein [Cupriavidus basilensis]MDF3882105.1 hypothetical protein [Cupriavidus basilensis]
MDFPQKKTKRWLADTGLERLAGVVLAQAQGSPDLFENGNYYQM